MTKPETTRKLSGLPLMIETGDETGCSFKDSEDDEYDLLEEIDDKSVISGNSNS